MRFRVHLGSRLFRAVLAAAQAHIEGRQETVAELAHAVEGVAR